MNVRCSSESTSQLNTPSPLPHLPPQGPAWISLSVVFWQPATREKVCTREAHKSWLSQTTALGRSQMSMSWVFCGGAWIVTHRPSPSSSWDGGRTSELVTFVLTWGTSAPQRVLGNVWRYFRPWWGVDVTGSWWVAPRDGSECPTMRRSSPHPSRTTKDHSAQNIRSPKVENSEDPSSFKRLEHGPLGGSPPPTS